MYVIIDGLGSRVGRVHCHNSAQMINSEPAEVIIYFYKYEGDYWRINALNLEFMLMWLAGVHTYLYLNLIKDSKLDCPINKDKVHKNAHYIHTTTLYLLDHDILILILLHGVTMMGIPVSRDQFISS